MTTLSHEEILRYNRQISLSGFDFDKQEQLKAASALIVGLGGLGCAAAQYLVAAGIGQVTLVDFDTITLSNLQRQILHIDERLNMAKVDSAAIALKALNPHVTIQPLNITTHDTQFAQYLANHTVILDCTDNIATRQQLNQLCYTIKKPLISGAAIRMEGQVTVFTYQAEQSCYNCLNQYITQQELSCAEAGVMSPVVGIIGSIQATEAIKIVTHFGQPLIGRLLFLDASNMQFHEFSLPKTKGCRICNES